MMFRTAFVTALLIAVGAAAQTGTTPKGKKKEDTPEGYTKDDLRGFTLYFSDEVLAQDRASKLERKPLEALEQELIVVERVLPADKVKHLKAVPIWVEWDERLVMNNGRAGRPVAVFYGGHQANLLGESKSPLKANAVTILSLRSLTSEHQPRTDSGRCVTLHELAHAFHYHVVGDSALVKQTYRQAMERKLYDPELYAATNDREYFAELSCAYLDRLDYFPRNRDELKKHDPKGYELMEKSWGKPPPRREPVAVKGPKLPSPNADGKHTLDLTTDQLRPGPAVVGEVPPKDDWKGRPVLVFMFPLRDGRAQVILSKINPWYADLKDHGLIALGAETSKADDEDVRKLVKQRDVAFPVVADVRAEITETFALPHAMVFDHAGKCVFRGAPLDAEPYVRIAVGKALLARTGKESFSKAARPVADLLEVGSPMGPVFAKLTEQSRTASGEAADELKRLQSVLTAGGQGVLDSATAKAKDDPVAAYFEAERLPAQYRGTPLEKSANQMLLKLRGNPKVEREFRARSSLAAIQKLDAQLSGRDLSINPRLPEFREENAALLRQLGEAVEKLKKAHPNMRATEEAQRIADRWGVAR